jgi:hypothetical protein
VCVCVCLFVCVCTHTDACLLRFAGQEEEGDKGKNRRVFRGNRDSKLAIKGAEGARSSGASGAFEDEKVVDGFVKSSSKILPKQVFQCPPIPADFNPFHRFEADLLLATKEVSAEAKQQSFLGSRPPLPPPVRAMLCAMCA